MSDPRRPSAIQWAEAARWLDRARDDLGVAEVLLAQSSPWMWGASLHAQQAAEKLAKATLIAYGSRPPHIHDIGELAEFVAAVHPDIGRAIGSLSQLTTWYISSRYPDIAAESLPSVADIRSALTILDSLCARIAALAPKT